MRNEIRYRMKLFLFGIIILIVSIAALIIYVHYFNSQYQESFWYQNGTIIEKYNNWYGKEILIEAEDGKRYLEMCETCLIGDKIELLMKDNHSLRISRSFLN